jgi:hypothetical protein
MERLACTAATVGYIWLPSVCSRVNTNAATTTIMERSKKLDPISIRLDPDVKAALEELAKADDRSLSAYINRTLRQHVEETKRREKKR